MWSMSRPRVDTPIAEPGVDANAEQNGEHRSSIEGESAPTEHKAILRPQHHYQHAGKSEFMDLMKIDCEAQTKQRRTQKTRLHDCHEEGFLKIFRANPEAPHVTENV